MATENPRLLLALEFFGRPLFSTSGEGFWHPPVDIHLTDNSVLVQIDIPGINPKEIEVSIEDNRLLARGKRTACKKVAKDEQCRYNETKRGDFHSVIDLPEYVDGSRATASSENGVLTIKTPKKKKAKAKVIKVQTK